MSTDYQIVSPTLTVTAMRDSGYKSTAYALAELIDNAIDATASTVEVFACESPTQLEHQVRPRIDTIAVLDNGTGMDRESLRRALKYGDGNRGDRQSIGRFGMGLPNSSMSQCTKVEVWSWTNGPGNALYTYLDLNEIENGRSEVPEPQHEPLPEQWHNRSIGLGPTGTLVVWTQLDRVQWYGAAATLKNTEQLIGRVYRHYLVSDEVNIRLVPVRNGEVLRGDERYALPNDPLYLEAPSCTPEPFADKPMFEALPMGNPGSPGEQQFAIEIGGVEHSVTIRVSIARPEARRSDVSGHPWPEGIKPKSDPGKHPWGQHAAKNIGISLVRRGRELDLDPSWAINYDTRERWWGIEIDFPPELDEIFGVTNNKQNATIFSALSDFDWDLEKSDETETFQALKERLAKNGDPRLPLIDLAQNIQKILKALRGRLKQQREGTRGGRNKRHNDELLNKATGGVNRRREEGHTGKTDDLDESTSPEQSREEQVKALNEKHKVDEELASSLVDEALKQNWRVRWLSTTEDNPAFFGVDLFAGMLQVNFNRNHPLHDELMAVLEDIPDEASTGELRERLDRASNTFKLLLFSWARYEDESPSEKLRQRAQEARYDWGRMARTFIEDEDDE